MMDCGIVWDMMVGAVVVLMIFCIAVAVVGSIWYFGEMDVSGRTD